MGLSAKRITTAKSTAGANLTVKIEEKFKRLFKVKIARGISPVARLKRALTDDKPALVKKDSSKKDKPQNPTKKVVKKEVRTPSPNVTAIPPVNYPIDLALMIRFSPRACPLPFTNFALLDGVHMGSNLLMIWDFCTSFSKAQPLLSPFS